MSKTRIEVKADNVATMRLYLNDHMVDFAKPLTVVVNKKVKFEGKVEPSVTEVLNDQLYLGRGWRYYGAVIDIDLAEPPPATRPATPPAGVPATPGKYGPGITPVAPPPAGRSSGRS
jgi:hypothetical protein